MVTGFIERQKDVKCYRMGQPAKTERIARGLMSQNSITLRQVVVLIRLSQTLARMFNLRITAHFLKL